MQIRNRETGAVVTVKQFKAGYPNTSFPKEITVEILDSYGYDPVLKGEPATVTPPYEVNTRDGEEQIDGKWYSRFVAGPIFVDDDESTAAEQEAAYRSKVDTDVARTVRKDRDNKLAQTDWTQLADSSANAADWSSYRQALRDVPSQAGFPHEVTWPTKPTL